MTPQSTRFSIEFDVSDQGFNFQISPSGVPTSLVVEILLSYLLGLKGQMDAASALNSDDARAWQLLGRLS